MIVQSTNSSSRYFAPQLAAEVESVAGSHAQESLDGSVRSSLVGVDGEINFGGDGEILNFIDG
jgi:hypothetical protein